MMTRKTAAVLSMVHEAAGARDAATRLFRAQPVLWWTLERLSRAQRIQATSLLCWEDQLLAAEPVAADHDAHILAKGPRCVIPALDAITAAQKWADGWRGGLHGTCAFDRGFYAPWILEICDKLECDSIVLIDPSAGLIDAKLVDALLEHADSAAGDAEICFSPAAPGASGVLIRRSLLERLAETKLHPGKLLGYNPQQPAPDPIAAKWCAPVPTSIARTPHRFTLDSDRQLSRMSLATVCLNGQLMRSDAEAILNHIAQCPIQDALPREVTLEINARRATRPIWWAGKHLKIERDEMTVEMARDLFDQLAQADDMRLTVAGVGDPLLAGNFFDIVEIARAAGIHAIHVETDLLGVETEDVHRLAESDVDVVSVHLPAATAQTYQKIMGVDGLTQAIMNVRALVEHRAKRNRGTPLVVPTFAKCLDNQAEMEIWYDRWLSALGSAVIFGPSDCAGQIPDSGVADMSPPRRKACARLSSRMTILSDGSVVACEQDAKGKYPIGNIARQSIAEIWQGPQDRLRGEHAAGNWNIHPLCGACREWHRP